MNLTNKFGLPTGLVRAIESHEHKGLDYSASMLDQSPRMVWLRKRHEDEASEDVSDRIWSILGTAFHSLMESGVDHANEESETFLKQEMMDGVFLSGVCDLYLRNEKKIRDYKTTSVWTIIYASRMEEWTKQLNTYAWLFRKIGKEVESLDTVVILRDWVASKAGEGTYPQCQVVVVPIELWTPEKQEAYIRERIELHESCKGMADNDLPRCTDEERWKQTDKRTGKVKYNRCLQYCLGHEWCNQYKETK